MYVKKLAVISALLLTLLSYPAAISLAADPLPKAAQAKVSSYAPADDLAGQIDFYVKQLTTALSDSASYDDLKQSQVEKDSNTLTVLALLLAMNDQEHKLKFAAPAILKSAQSLAETYGNYDQANKALVEVKKALAAESKSEYKVQWEAVAAMSPLMKQVPIVHAPLKRGATDPRRFKRQADQTAGQAATLAAIAQASMFNVDHAEEAQIPAWQKYCAEMRDAAGAVNNAVRNGDASKAAQAISALQKSCDDCHAVFNAE